MTVSTPQPPPPIKVPSTRLVAASPVLQTPTLASLPGGLVPAEGTSLTVALPRHPSSTELRAGIVAAGAVQRAAGRAGLHVDVTEADAAINAAGGPAIRIDERPGAPVLSLGHDAAGLPLLTISGHGAGLLRAARTLASPAIAGLAGSTATAPADIAPELTVAPRFRGVSVPETATSGRSLTASFRLPVDRQINGEAKLRVGVAYDAPQGGRVIVSLNGNQLGAFKLPGDGTIRQTQTFKLAADPTVGGDLNPGWWLQPAANQLQLTAQPNGSSHGATTLQLLSGTKLTTSMSSRPPALQLGLWPFPLYGSHAWADSTVVLAPRTGTPALSALVTALANSERVTGVTADPQVSYGVPDTAQLGGNLIIVDPVNPGGQSLLEATATIADFKPTQASLDGVLEEAKIPQGGVALVAHGPRALTALGASYQPAQLSGRAVLVDAAGRIHVLAAGQAEPLFTTPRWPWLAPAAFLALLALGWLGLRAARARRRLVELPPLATKGGAG